MLLLLAFSPAFALCLEVPATMIPRDGAGGVPTDGRIIWVTSSGLQEEGVVMTDASGAEVPTTIAWVESGGNEVYAVLTPVGALPADAAFVVTDGTTTRGFSTGETTSWPVTAPVIEAVEAEARPGVEPVCPAEASAWIEGHERVKVSVRVEEPAAGFVEARVRGSDGVEHTVYGDAGGVIARWGGCARSNIPSDPEEERLTVSVRAVSYTGVLSAWSEEQEVVLPWPEAPDCPGTSAGTSAGCATRSGGPLGVVLAFTGLIAAASRRRRRR